MDHSTLLSPDDLFAACATSPERFLDFAPAILRVCADGEITAWVIQHGTHFERVAWAALLIEAASEEQVFLDHPQMVALFGKRWADCFRLGLYRLRRKIVRQFATPIA